MDFVKYNGVGKERVEAGFGAKINRPPAICGAREIRLVGVEEDAPA